MRIHKTVRYLESVGKVATLTGLPILAAPSPALASGDWVSGTLDTAAQKVGKSEADTASGSGIISGVTAVTTWLLGIAIVIFVLKVVLTAVDRILTEPEASITRKVGNTYYFSDSLLQGIPIIGAYPMPEYEIGNPESDASGHRGWTWAKIWKNFAMQLLIAVGAWFFVQLIVGFLVALFSKVDPATP